MQPHLVDRTSKEAEFDVAKTYVAKFKGDEKTKLTTTELFSKQYEALNVMPTVHLALKLGVTLRLPQSVRIRFFILKTIMRDRWQSMKDACKAHLVQVAFESDLTKKPKN